MARACIYLYKYIMNKPITISLSIRPTFSGPTVLLICKNDRRRRCEGHDDAVTRQIETDPAPCARNTINLKMFFLCKSRRISIFEIIIIHQSPPVHIDDRGGWGVGGAPSFPPKWQKRFEFSFPPNIFPLLLAGYTTFCSRAEKRIKFYCFSFLSARIKMP